MNYVVSDAYKFTCEVIAERCSQKELSDRYEFKTLLQCLSPLEQLLVARYFCKSPWNIGSLRVLSVLQETSLLTSTNFLLSLQISDADVHLILNDFLEGEFELLMKLFISANCDATIAIRLNDLLDECLRRLFADLLQNPALNNLDYLQYIAKHMPKDFMLKVMQQHINVIMELRQSNIKEAFANFTIWINEGVDTIQFTKDLYDKLLHHSPQEVVAYLFKLSTVENFRSWKFYLILLQTIASRNEQKIATYIRAYFKSRLGQIVALPSRNAMLHLLLSVRAATATTLDIDKNVTAYADWYKQHIADMKFVLKTEEFQTVLALLEECIAYETAEDYIEIHATFSISPPVHCGRLVQAYRSKCKLQLGKIKSQNKQNPYNDEKSIIIDDSD